MGSTAAEGNWIDASARRPRLPMEASPAWVVGLAEAKFEYGARREIATTASRGSGNR
jgi:hypothetical protein